ncbi:MAG TPA: dienelactone hydrolase family protein [Hyphomicrobiaceae bacterium]|jgi:dienelactone hydrolase|nr:dienelactone hydrolase family protein [Hyphomicrobiaceae bacterium]
MKPAPWLATSALAAMTVLPATAQVAGTKDLPVRVELHGVTSLWLTDQQFLAGDPNGKEVTLGVELRIAQGPGRRPTMILMHGSGGIGANVPFWARHFNAMGINTVTIDGMTGRGLTGVGDKQAVLGRLNFILDIYRTMEVIGRHPRVDTGKVALIGFSRGGQAALYASLARFHRTWNKSGIDLAAYIPFYPDCATTYRSDTETTGKPIRIFHGTPDNYNPVATCKAYVARLKEAKRDVELNEYPNAPHGFDNPIGASPAVAAKANQSVRDCKIEEGPGSQLINAETKAPFSYTDACVKLDPLVGGDREAGESALREVTAFVSKVFALD